MQQTSQTLSAIMTKLLLSNVLWMVWYIIIGICDVNSVTYLSIFLHNHSVIANYLKHCTPTTNYSILTIVSIQRFLWV